MSDKQSNRTLMLVAASAVLTAALVLLGLRLERSLGGRQPEMMDRAWLWKETVQPWLDIEKKGVGVMIGEFDEAARDGQLMHLVGPPFLGRSQSRTDRSNFDPANQSICSTE